MGSSKKDLKRFPEEVKRNVGYALHFAQEGVTHPSCKLLKGYGSGVYEIIEDYNTDTYRAVYLVRFEKIIYVIHAFQKKSKEGIKTPQRELNVIQERLKKVQEIENEKKNKRL